MTIEGYEAVGDPLAEWTPSKKERRQRQAEVQRLALRHSWTDDMRLTWDELEAGTPCRGCGMPWRGGPDLDVCGMERSALDVMRRSGPIELDGEGQAGRSEEPRLFASHVVDLVGQGLVARDGSTLKITQRARRWLAAREREEARHKAQHTECRAIQWSGGGYLHCGNCCPPPPLSPEVLNRIAPILRDILLRPRTELMRWRLRLFCGHVVEATAHYSHKRYPSDSIECPDCGLDPATVVAAEAIGRVDEPPPTAPTPRQRRVNARRAGLVEAIAKCEAELRRLRSQLDAEDHQ